MSECEKIVKLLLSHGGSEPPADQARRIEAHLAECPACRGELEDLLSAGGALREVPAVGRERWEAIWSSIEGKAERQHTARRLRRALWRGAAVTAIAACVLTAAYIFLPAPGVEPVGGTAAPLVAGFEVLSIEVESPEYSVFVMAAGEEEIPVIWLEKM